MSHNKLSNETLGMLAAAFEKNKDVEEITIMHNDLSMPNGIILI
jgi:hypothetical protein